MTDLLTENALSSCLDNENIKPTATTISMNILSGQIDFVQFIEALGFALKSTTQTRGKAMQLLSETLSQMPVDFFQTTQLEVILMFYCNRLKDHHSVFPAVLSGLLAMVQMKNLPKESVCQLLRALFLNVTCQSQVKDDRQNYFQILKTLSENQTKELLTMGPDFVYGVINAMDGERDPQLLLFLFDFLPTFLKTFPLHHLSEEMFEVCSCYFPIDYFPAADDPQAITRQILADKLSSCLCGSQDFADSCIELCLDKIDSQLTVAKLDSLNLLAKSAKAFKPNDLEKYFQRIWTVLKIELLPGTNKELSTAALTALECFVNATSVDETICRNILVIVFETILIQLSDAGAKNFSPAFTVALSCASSSKLAGSQVANKVIPLIQSQIKQNCENVVQKSRLLEIITQLIVICNDQNIELNAELLRPVHDELFDCINQNSNNLILYKTGLECVTQLATTISIENRQILYNVLLEKLQSTSMVDEIQATFKVFAEYFPTEMLSVVNELVDIGQKMEVYAADQIFMALCSIVHIPELKNVALTFLFENAYRQTNVQLIIIKNIRKLLEQNASEDIRIELIDNYNIIANMFQLAQNHIHSNYDILEEISKILASVLRHLKQYFQSNVLAQYLHKLKLSGAGDLYLAVGLLSYIHKDTDSNHINAIIAELTDISLNSDNSMANISNKLMCSLFNKLSANDLYEHQISQSIEKTKLEVGKENVCAIYTSAWMIKGMIVRGHPKAVILLNIFLELLNHATLAKVIPQAFEIIESEPQDVDLPCTTFLHRQKFFQIVLSKVWPNLSTFTNYHFAVLTIVCKSTPRQILKINLDKVGILLFKCIELNSILPLLISLEIIKDFLDDGSEYFKDHLQHLIPSFIKLCTFQSSMKVRIIAIECLTTISRSFPALILIPYKLDVTQGLLAPLDDTKRLVRNAAVDARNRWFLLEPDKNSK